VLYQLSYLAAGHDPSVGASQSPASLSCSDVSELIHTCYRITDIDRSVSFYEKLGFEELRRLPIRDEAINVFMGLPGDGARLELTWNRDQDGPYDVGTGYGHIAVTVADMDKTLEGLAAEGIEPERPPYSIREGGSRLCFVRDPDDYRIELIERGT
jgi:lactoylglutathione lyase